MSLPILAPTIPEETSISCCTAARSGVVSVVKTPTSLPVESLVRARSRADIASTVGMYSLIGGGGLTTGSVGTRLPDWSFQTTLYQPKSRAALSVVNDRTFGLVGSVSGS